VHALAVPDLEARPLQDPQVADLLSDAGHQVPGRPSLLIIGDGGDVDVVSGWEMRRRLAGIIGWRRAATLSRLAAAEGRARLKKLARPSVPTRRKVIGGGLAAGLAGGLAWALRSPSPASAAYRPDAGGSPLTPASPAETDQLLAATSVQRTISTWGPVSKIYKTSSGTFILDHSRTHVVTFVDALPGTANRGSVTAWSLGPTPGAKSGFRTYLANGTALTDTAPDGTVTAAYERGTEPDGITWAELQLFIACVGKLPGAFICATNCITCATTRSGEACSYCYICADAAVTQCVKDIFGLTLAPS
jgi:hypothetical protein